MISPYFFTVQTQLSEIKPWHSAFWQDGKKPQLPWWKHRWHFHIMLSSLKSWRRKASNQRVSDDILMTYSLCVRSLASTGVLITALHLHALMRGSPDSLTLGCTDKDNVRICLSWRVYWGQTRRRKMPASFVRVLNMIPVKWEAHLVSMNGHQSLCNCLREGLITPNQCSFLFGCQDLCFPMHGRFSSNTFKPQARKSPSKARLWPPGRPERHVLRRVLTFILKGLVPASVRGERVKSVSGMRLRNKAWPQEQVTAAETFNWHGHLEFLLRLFDIYRRSLQCQPVG